MLLPSFAGFVGEVKHKYTAQMADVFRETFCWLPLGFVVGGKVLVVSGVGGASVGRKWEPAIQHG